MTAKVDEFIPTIYSQRGDPYVFGAEASWSDPNPDAFDCSELIEWGCRRIGLYFPDGSYNQFNYCRNKGTLVPIATAIANFGYLLFRMSGSPTHVAASLGTGSTMEARGRAYGVNTFSAYNRGWTHAARIPGMDYTRINRDTYVAPAPANQLRTVMDARDALIHDSIGATERNVAALMLQHFGLTPTMQPNTGTKDGLQATQEMMARVQSDVAIINRSLGVPVV